jgi:hypothetical protein
MLVFGAIADRFGRRRIMLIGLVLLGLASLATAFVCTAEQLIAVRLAMGIAAAMTTPGSMALAFRLFDEDGLRVRATTLISTVGLVGLAIGPTVGGFVLAVAPWQVLLLVNVPIAVLAIIGVRVGIAADIAGDQHLDPVDIAGAVLGTATIVLALVAPTLFVNEGAESWVPAAGLATAGFGYLVTLQLQLDWGWTPALAAIGGRGHDRGPRAHSRGGSARRFWDRPGRGASRTARQRRPSTTKLLSRPDARPRYTSRHVARACGRRAGRAPVRSAACLLTAVVRPTDCGGCPGCAPPPTRPRSGPAGSASGSAGSAGPRRRRLDPAAVDRHRCASGSDRRRRSGSAHLPRPADPGGSLHRPMWTVDRAAAIAPATIHSGVSWRLPRLGITTG